MPKSNIKFIPIQNKSVIVHVSSILFIVCLYSCLCECLPQNNNHKTKHKNNNSSKQHSCVRGPLWECCLIWSDASALPSYCTPLVCISAEIGLLAVCQHNKPKTKNQIFAFVWCLFLVCLYICECECLLQNNIHVSEVHCGSAITVRFGQTLPGFLITAHHLCTSLL